MRSEILDDLRLGQLVLLFAGIALAAPDTPVPPELDGQIVVTSRMLRWYIQPPLLVGLQNAVKGFLAEGATADMVRWTHAVEITSARTGLLLCGDLEIAKRILAVERREPDDPSLAEKLRELLVFWVSPQHHALGLAITAGGRGQPARADTSSGERRTWYDNQDAELASPHQEESPMSDNAPEITDHRGDALKSDADVFAPAPPEIGPVLSLCTSLKKTDQPRSLSTRIAGVVISAGVVTGLGLLVEVGIGIALDGLGSFVVPLGFGAIAGLIMWLSVGFSHTLTYVGKRGVAAFTMIGTRARITRSELFLFKRATELRTRRTRRITNGTYMGTDFDFSWFSEADGKLHTIADTYDSTAKTPPSGGRYPYALAAEAAWSNHILRRLKTELEKTGSIEFNVGSGDWIRIRPGFLDFSSKGQTEHCAPADIANISVADGVFTIKLRDAPDDVFSFTYGTMANAQVFLLALDDILGLTLS